MQKFILIGVVVGLLIVGTAFSFRVLNQKLPLNSNRSIAEISQMLSPQKSIPSSPPVPFAELTVPYLRSRSYTSQLGELQKVSENARYTNYLTSYTSDGLRINGQLTQPKGEMPSNGWPAIVFIHGYIEPTRYQTLQNYASYVDYFARNGFVVLKIDLRGHADSEGEAGGGYYSGDYVIDTLNAYAALQASDFVDPQAVGVWGHSMAGNVVLRSVVAKQNIPAVVIWAGAVYTYEDMQKLGIDDNSYRAPATSTERARKRKELFDTHGQFSPTSPFWQQVVPTNYLEGVTTALQIHHAVNDSVVSIEYSRGLMNVLNNTNIEHQLYEYPTGGHNLTGVSYTQAMQRSVEFFHSKLK